MENCTLINYIRTNNNPIFYRRTSTGEFNINGNPPEAGIILNPDWGGCLYFFPANQRREPVERALEGYRIDHPYIMIAEYTNAVNPLKVICCKHSSFKDGDYQNYMYDLIGEIQNKLRQEKPENTPFMRWLESHGYAFQCYHNDEGVMELIIPKSFFVGNNINNWNFIFERG